MSVDLEQLKYPIGRYKRPDGYSAKDINEWLSVISALPQWLDHCIENLDAAQLETSYRPDGWTINQVIHHIADTHMNAYVRSKLALTEEKPTVAPYQEAVWANLPDVTHTPVNVSITLLHALHRRWVALLQNLEPEDWLKEYYQPEDKEYVPLWVLISLYAWHSRHHMEQIRQLRERMGW